MERITSRQNPLITRLRRLGAEKKARRAEGVFLCEGVKLVGEALRWGPPPELLVVAEGTAPPAELPAGVRVVEVPEALVVNAWAEEAGGRTVMGFRHRDYPTHGVQFHPESYLTEAGKLILKNFLEDPWTR